MNLHLVASCALAIVGIADASSQTKTVTFQIAVEKHVLGEGAPRPFHGVGTFDLLRGSSPLDGARCPDKSNAEGRVTCVVPCKDDDSIPMVVRVRPPSDQDALAGWVAPSVKDVEVAKCVIRPTKLTMVYEDARFALNELLSKKYFAASGGGVSTGSASLKVWVTAITKDSSVAAKVAATAKTSTGRLELLQLHQLATSAASAPNLQKSNLSMEERELTDALAKWQVLSKSALLESQMTLTLSPAQQSKYKIQPTTDLATYRLNLIQADEALAHAPRSSSQLRLADDVKTLKALPATGRGAAPADKIINSWR